MLRPRSTLGPCLVLVLGCNGGAEGDELPPGAFTSGDDSVVVPTDDAGTTMITTTSDPSGTSDDPTTSPPPETGESTGPIELSHDQHILPIWTDNCTDSSCHDPDAPQAGLDLSSAGVLDRICNDFHAFSGMPYIDCEGHDPQNSYIFRKLENTHTMGVSGGSGLPMPPDGSLPDDELALVQAWIEGGTLP